jgi:hypothetical protein
MSDDFLTSNPATLANPDAADKGPGSAEMHIWDYAGLKSAGLS